MTQQEHWKHMVEKPGGDLDQYRAALKKNPVTLAQKPMSTRAIAGGRLVNETYQYDTVSSKFIDYRPGQSYNLLNQQRKNLFRMPFKQLRQMAFDLSPELNKTLWDFLRYCNPGYIIEAESDRAQRATEEFIEELSELHGSFGNLLENSFSNLFRAGRTLKELVLDASARVPIDVYIPDPDIVEFRRLERGARGKVWVLGMQSNDGWIPLEDPTIFFLAIDGDANNPEGKSMINPAIYDAISLLLIKQAVQRVLENQGYSRQDYEINTEALLQLAQNEEADLTPAQRDQADARYIDNFIKDVNNVLEKKEVDSDYVHSDLIKVNYAAGSLSGNALSSVDSFVHRLQQGVTIGGKSIPLLTGDNESLADSQAERQLESYSDGTITPIQLKESDQWSRLFTLANRVRGIRGDVRFLFQKRRVRDLKSIAETEKIQIENIIAKMTAGFINEQEATDEIQMLRDPLIV